MNENRVLVWVTYTSIATLLTLILMIVYLTLLFVLMIDPTSLTVHYFADLNEPIVAQVIE
ncbi:hypothetical protein ACQKOF_22305 [Lysinibacillus sp. NPDC093190]|uniref:hypothetical protein n=1 Tax=Lysinibacillus sp. NPDC093190 TaxID=3390575 RepID=UPI003D00516A